MGKAPLPVKPRRIEEGSRIYHVWKGAIREYGICGGVFYGQPWEGPKRCWWATYQPGSLTRIEPVPMKGFQGWRYYDEG